MRPPNLDERNPILCTLRALQPQLHAAGVAHMSVFGSVARGEDTASSDVDLEFDLVPGAAPDGFLLERQAIGAARDLPRT